MSGLRFDDRLAQERRARLQAERLLAQKSEELYAANRKLAEHADSLSDQVIEQREENAALLGQATQTAAKLEVVTEKAVIAERRLWDSITSIEDGFAIFDSDWRMVAANTAFLGVFDGLDDVAPGASYEAVLRLAVDEGVVDLDGVMGDDWIDAMIARWEADPIPERTLRLWNGAYIRLVDTRTPEGDTVSLSLNITDTIRREAKLKDARQKAEVANRAKSAFLANMSHEIRTPMNGVVGMADLMLDGPLDEDQRLYAQTIRNSGEALLSIINDVLDYSKIEAERLVIHPAPFDLSQLLEEVINLLRPSIEGKPIELRQKVQDGLPPLLIGDAGRVRQVLTNLIGNALKFTAEGHVLVSLTAKPAADGTLSASITIEDTGIGIAPEKQALIFGEFNQVEDQANRNFEGTGLGLAISQRLVEMMGGNIWVTSELGRGSVFGFTLPLGLEELEPVPPEPIAEGEPVPARKLQLLAAEDNKTNRLVFQRLLKTLGFDLELTLTNNGAELVAAYKDAPPDLIFTDISMPIKDGLEASGDIRAYEIEHGLARVPIIAMTAHAMAEDEARILASGIDRYITKPLAKAKISAAILELAPEELGLNAPLEGD